MILSYNTPSVSEGAQTVCLKKKKKKGVASDNTEFLQKCFFSSLCLPSSIGWGSYHHNLIRG